LRSADLKGEKAPNYSVRVANIANRQSLSALKYTRDKFDAVVHAAASLDKDFYASSVPLVNCFGTQNALWLSDYWQCSSFVYISGVSVIGKPIYSPITEEHPVTPTTAYLASKLFGEHLVQIASQNGKNAVSLRVTAPLSPQMPSKRFLTNTVRRALKNDVVELNGTGSRIQNYIDVRDVAQATLLSIEKNISGLFNIAGEKSISNLELVSRCIERCGSNSQIVFNGIEDAEDQYKWEVSYQKAKRKFGFTPAYSIDESIDSVIESYKMKVN
jgi:UDP-glucose 4-epimerase